MLFFLTGVIFCIFFYPKNVAILAILFLSVGDPCASACGIRSVTPPILNNHPHQPQRLRTRSQLPPRAPLSPKATAPSHISRAHDAE